MIETKISIRKIILMVLETSLLAVFSAFIVTSICIGFGYLINGSWLNMETRQQTSLYGMVILYPVIVYLRIRYYKKMECWSVDGNYLYRGKNKEFKVDLTKIDIAILGMPHIKIKNALLKALSSRQIESNNSIAENILILKINKNRYLPLFLFETDVGFEIMNNVLSIVSDKIVQDYDFNKIEKRKLKGNILNKVIDIQA